MKRRLYAAAVLLCVVAAFLLPSGKAAGTVYFSAINNKLLPLSDTMMPMIYGGQIYLPYSFFHSAELGVYSSGGENIALIYSGTKKLTFDLNKAVIVDQDGVQYYNYTARLNNGIVYVPAKFVCEFFGFLPPTLIQAQPAPIVRVRSDTNTINDLTFPTIGIIKQQLQAEYDKYTTPADPSTSPTPSTPEPPTYEDISVYLSFYNLSGGELARIMETFERTSYKACFFVTADEIAANADLLRRAACNGHTIGVFLTDLTAEGAYKEYRDASALLFEAVNVKTVIVTALGEAAAAAEDMAKEKSLVFWRPTKYYDAEAKLTVAGVTGKLSTVKGTRESLYFTCSEKVSGILRPFLSYLSQYEYGVRRVTETSVPVRTA